MPRFAFLLSVTLFGFLAMASPATSFGVSLNAKSAAESPIRFILTNESCVEWNCNRTQCECCSPLPATLSGAFDLVVNASGSASPPSYSVEQFVITASSLSLTWFGSGEIDALSRPFLRAPHATSWTTLRRSLHTDHSLRTMKQSMPLDDAEALFKSMLSKHPKDLRALTGLGYINLQRKKHGEAAQTLEKVVEIDPNYPEANFFYGEALAGLGDLPRATTHYQKAISLREEYPEAHNKLGIALWGQGKFQDCEKHFQRAIELRPDHFEAYSNFGGVLFSQGKLDEAEEQMLTSLKLNPENLPGHFNLGNIYFNMGKYEEAIKYYRNVISLKEDDYEAYQNLGLAQEKLGRMEEAIESLDMAIRINPGASDMHLNLGIMCRKIGKTQVAIDAFKEALQVNDRDTDALIQLADIAQIDSDPELAKSYLQRALDANPDLSEAHYYLGIQLYEEGDVLQARSHLEQACQRSPLFEHKLKAWIAERRERKVEAAADLQTVFIVKKRTMKASE